MITTEQRHAIAAQPYVPPTKIRRVTPSSMADYLIAHPGCTRDDMALEFTPSEVTAHYEAARTLAITRAGEMA